MEDTLNIEKYSYMCLILNPDPDSNFTYGETEVQPR